jgi:hypothetical protein
MVIYPGGRSNVIVRYEIGLWGLSGFEPIFDSAP